MAGTGSYFDAKTPDIVLRSLFTKYDKDGSGHLHSDELCTLLVDDLGLDESEAKSYALLLDKDGSTGISFDEFLGWLRSGERFKMVEDSSRFHLLTKAVEMFEQYDADGSKSIGKDEFLKLHLDLGGKPELVDSALSALDRDGNGVISFPEFLKWLNWIPFDGF